MATLLLNRRCTVIDADPPAATVVCEPRDNISRGWLARIAPGPNDPYGLWSRVYLDGTRDRRDGREALVYARLGPGCYEAHSTLRTRTAHAICFVVTAGGDIEILGGRGDEDVVIARLNGLTLGELHDARAAAVVGDAPPQLEGSIRQVAWAETIRDALVDAALDDGDDELAVGLWEVRQASWFIANQGRTPGELRGRLGAPA